METAKEWIFTGGSGREYKFEKISKNGPLPECGGVFVLAYTHLRGHISGWQVNVLCMDASSNLQQAVEQLPNREALEHECWNATYVLPVKASAEKDAILQDLRSQNPVPAHLC